MQSFMLWCGGVEKELHEPLHFRDIPEKFCFLGEKRRFMKNMAGKFCILGRKRRFIKKLVEEFCFLGEKRHFIKNPAKKCERFSRAGKVSVTRNVPCLA